MQNVFFKVQYGSHKFKHKYYGFTVHKVTKDKEAKIFFPKNNNLSSKFLGSSFVYNCRRR